MHILHVQATRTIANCRQIHSRMAYLTGKDWSTKVLKKCKERKFRSYILPNMFCFFVLCEVIATIQGFTHASRTSASSWWESAACGLSQSWTTLISLSSYAAGTWWSSTSSQLGSGTQPPGMSFYMGEGRQPGRREKNGNLYKNCFNSGAFGQ